ncbi:hypothetical protein ACVNIS_10440 [Sphaerotilaceae bacterium SBD11-9]
MAKIFSSTNNFSARQTQGGDGQFVNHQGICAALTSLWCLHMQEGKRDLLTKPSNERAQALQVLYRWDPSDNGQYRLNLLNRIGLKGTVEFTASSTNIALTQVCARPSAYYLAVPGHAVGAAVLNNRYYFYDCDENGAGGLYAFESADEWRDLINQHYANQRVLGISTKL